MEINGVGLTDVGQKRDHNEDYFLIDPELGLYMVCDGMGGHAAGEVASEMAATTVKRYIEKNEKVLQEFRDNDNPQTRDKIAALVERAVQRACREVYKAAQADKSKSGMGTTLEMLLVVGDKGVMGHVGDSRLYLTRNGQLHQLSEDHSYVTEMIKRGKMTREEARASPFGNVITRAVGIQESVQVDSLIMDILPGDTYLLCSDGLSSYMDDPNEMAKYMGREDLEASTTKFIELANQRGGSDNITVVMVRGVPSPEEAVEQEKRAQDVFHQLDVLRQISLFRHLNYKELVKVLNITRVENYDPHVTVISEGAKGAELYVVLSGKLDVMREGQNIAKLETGMHFGEMALVDQSPRSATVVVESASRLMIVERRDFYNLIRKEPILAVKLLWSFVQSLSGRLRSANDLLSDARANIEDDETIPFLNPESYAEEGADIVEPPALVPEE
ncbi:MAG: protein phosphatase [Myxococcales bacterium]|nr:protein phosphatase [Myxococcales bacterium]|tara:strand:- start:552 stop:1889 length:1338 start_codon:yes stop_codon:yes gene_type:complete